MGGSYVKAVYCGIFLYDENVSAVDL